MDLCGGYVGGGKRDVGELRGGGGGGSVEGGTCGGNFGGGAWGRVIGVNWGGGKSRGRVTWFVWG